MASKKVRFEIFKRDGFRCQYCGRTPPEVILELDHVIPISKGGPDDINNYVTACFDCNRGKRDKTLDILPTGLQENISRMKEKREQIKAYNQFLSKIQKETEIAINEIDFIYNNYFADYCLSGNFKNNTLKNFLTYLPKIKIAEAMDMACSKFEKETPVDESSTKAIMYFCGICWNWIKKPETRNW